MGQTSSLSLIRPDESELDIINQLSIAKAVDFSEVDQEGRTALHLAASQDKSHVCQILIDTYQVDVDAVDQYGNTALHSAVYSGSAKAAKALLERNANINAQDSSGMSPLHWAVEKTRRSCTILLLAHGADQTLKNNRGETPLSLVYKKKKQTVVNEFLDILNKPNSFSPSLGLKSNPSFTRANTYLVGLCKLWGLIKYTHPYLSYRNIKWDEALIESLPTFLNKDSTNSDYVESIVRMIHKLKDFNTRVYCNQKVVHLSSFKNGDPKTEESMPAKELVDDFSDLPQPSVEKFHDVSYIALTDHKQFEDWAKLKELTEVFQEVRSTAQAVIFDVRLRDDYFGRGTSNLGSMFQDAIRLLVNEPIVLPTTRQRICNGLTEHQKAHPSITSIFTQGFYTSEAEVLFPGPEPNQKPILLSFIVDKNTPSNIIDIAISFQAQGMGHIIYVVDEGDHYQVGGGRAATLVYEPGISSTIFPFPASDIDLKVFIRQNERLNPDSTVGFRPDTILYKSNLVKASEPRDAALKLILNGGHKAPKSQPHHIYAVRRHEDDPCKDELPSMEMRILSLFRLWCSVNHFFPYKGLTDNAWEFELYKFIDIFKNANSNQAYHVAVAELVTKLSDTHAYVRSPILANLIGTHSPPLRVKTINDNIVITEILDPNDESLRQVSVGDIVSHIDNVPASTRRDILNRYLSSSTLQSSYWRTDMKLLAGPEHSTAKLEIRKIVSRSTGKDKDDDYLDVVVEVSRNNQSHAPSGRKNPRTYDILPHIDSHGNQISYVDLTRLFFHEVDVALNSIISDDTTSLILDLRGYTRGTIYRLAPRLSSVKSVIAATEMPLLMPSLLSDDQTHQSSFLRTLQTSFISDTNDVLDEKIKIVALINEETISHGEYSVAYLKAIKQDTTLIGTPSSGSVGNITNILLPGGLVVGFTGMSITKPDGTQIQRKGIEPDLLVQESIVDIQEGKDRILEAAVDYLKKNKIDSMPLKK